MAGFALSGAIFLSQEEMILLLDFSHSPTL